jgi:hypothetical protein
MLPSMTSPGLPRVQVVGDLVDVGADLAQLAPTFGCRSGGPLAQGRDEKAGAAVFKRFAVQRLGPGPSSAVVKNSFQCSNVSLPLRRSPGIP